MSASSASTRNRTPYSSVDMHKAYSGSWKLEIGSDLIL